MYKDLQNIQTSPGLTQFIMLLKVLAGRKKNIRQKIIVLFYFKGKGGQS